MKILIIKTGGTIGSAYSETEIVQGENKENQLVNNTGFSDITFETIDLMNVFSENIGFEHWNILLNYLYSLNYDNYSGIIITHGSDTLSYTSALLGNIFKNISTTMVITASDKPLENPDSNGFDNFSCSVKLIQKQIKGVYTVWKNKGENTKVYDATDICESDPMLDNFISFCKNPVGDISGESLRIDTNISKSDTSSDFQNLILKNQVLLIRCYPQIDFNAFKLENYSSVVVYLYHSGTAPTDSQSSICDFIKLCTKANIPVYLASFKNTDKYYETTNKMLEFGGIKLYNCSPENAYAQALIKANTKPK